ncbi:uncharacterized protein LOC105897427 isoform X2 [Clupea harengus]|uniref:Uncharacterized protein LOC105897427 isoform X2 n=1 Tax=Clupea harengus TaxID=7950 RepID=A0A6P8FNM7_CLUHA|nr:uncharacterized protein LOC105897427 isoform X2 [Clupea harengus]
MMICKVSRTIVFLFSIWMAVCHTGSPVNTEGISQPTPVMTAKTGTTVTLECFVSEKTQTEPIVWYKLSVGQMPLLVGSAQRFWSSVLYNEFNNDRFIINSDSVSVRLSISNIKSSDEAFYLCGVRIIYDIYFGNGTFLLVEEKGQLRSNAAAVIQAPVSDPVHPGDSTTLECEVLTETRTEDLRVFWFRPASGDSHPGVIYTNNSRGGQCEGRCVYSLSKKDINISDAGIYYCGIATSRHILFGNGTALNIAEPVDTVPVGLAVALGCCAALMFFLFVLNCNRRVTCDNCKIRDLQHVRDGSCETRQRSGQAEAAEDLTYAALSFSKKETRGRRTKRKLPPDAVYSAVQL